MAGSTVVVSVLSDSSKFKRDLDSIGDSTNRLGSFFSSFGKIAGVALLAAGVAVAGFLGSSIKAAGELEKIAAQTNAVLASTGGAAGKSFQDLDGLATRLSKISGIDDEVIAKGQNLLLTFTNIQGTNFDKATQSALDMSVAMGTDLQSSVTLVGKALNDPIQGVSALQRVGVQLTDSQKDLIQSFIDVGDVAGAQGVILEELNRQFGGSAEAFGSTFLGTLGKVKVAFGNIQETIGGAFLPVITQVLSKVNDVLVSIGESPAFQAIVDQVATFVSGLLAGGPAADGLAQAFSIVSAVLNPFGLIIQALVPILPTLIDSFQALGKALGGALMSVLPALSTLLDAIISALSGVLAAVLPVVIGLVIKLADIFAKLAPILTPIVILLAGVLGDALTSLVPLITLVANVVGELLGAALEAIVPLLTALAPVFEAIIGIVTPLIDIVISLVTPFLTLLGPIGQLVGALLPPLIELMLKFSPVLLVLLPLLELLTPVLEFIADGLGQVVDWVVQAIDSFVALSDGSEESKGKILSIWQGVLDFFRGIPAAIGGFFAGAAGWLVDAGANIVRGLMNGIRSLASTIGSFFLNLLPSFIVGPFKAALGIRSPSTVFEALGRFIPMGLVNGVKQGVNAVRQVAGSMADAAVAGFDPQFGAGASFAGSAGTFNTSTGSTSREVHIHLDGAVYLTQAEVGRAVRDALEEYDRLNGDR